MIIVYNAHKEKRYRLGERWNWDEWYSTLLITVVCSSDRKYYFSVHPWEQLVKKKLKVFETALEDKHRKPRFYQWLSRNTIFAALGNTSGRPRALRRRVIELRWNVLSLSLFQLYISTKSWTNYHSTIRAMNTRFLLVDLELCQKIQLALLKVSHHFSGQSNPLIKADLDHSVKPELWTDDRFGKILGCCCFCCF